MSESAYKNALNRRDQLLSEIEGAKRTIEAREYELRSVEGFLEMYAKFANAESVPVTKGEYKANPKALDFKVIASKTQKNSKKEDVAKAAREIILARGAPVSRWDLYMELMARGFVIEGTNAEMVLSTMLWRMSNLVVRLKGGGYWLTEVPYEPAGYVPEVDPISRQIPDDLAEIFGKD